MSPFGPSRRQQNVRYWEEPDLRAIKRDEIPLNRHALYFLWSMTFPKAGYQPGSRPGQAFQDHALQFERHRHRHMVGRPCGAAIMLGHRDVGDTVGKHLRSPDMIEAPAFVGGEPIRRTVAPPSVELGRLGRELAHAVDPGSGFLHACEFVALDWRVRNDTKHLLVAPDIVLERRHIEIADKNGPLGWPRTQGRVVAHLVEEA